MPAKVFTIQKCFKMRFSDFPVKSSFFNVFLLKTLMPMALSVAWCSGVLDANFTSAIELYCTHVSDLFSLIARSDANKYFCIILYG